MVISRYLTVGRFVLVLAGLSVLTGCSKTGPEFAVEVEGTITLNGKPLPNVEVVFMSELADAKGTANPASSGYSDEHGHYSLWCGQADTQGAVLGTYRVCVNDIAAMPLPAMEYGDDLAAARLHRPGPLRVPSRYSSTAKTPFKDVKIASGKMSLNFDVKTNGR